MTHDDHHHHRHFNKKRLIHAVIITFATMLLEIAGGIYTHSLALLSDSAHMFSHVFSLGLSYFAIVISLKPATSHMTYGYYRAEILAAFINGLTLFLIVAAILYGAYARLQEPSEIHSGSMLIVAAIGLVVNVATAMLLHSGSREDMNVKGAFFHSLGDMISSIGVVGAAIAIHYTNLIILDTLVSILIALVISYWGIQLMRDSTHILLEGMPRGLDIEKVKAAIKESVDKPTFIHHVHAWQISTHIYAFTAHIIIDHRLDQHETTRYLQTIKKKLADKFNIHHTTIQFESKACDEVK